ncbi:MAG: YdcF family protein [Rubrivivax sp.]|nr:YdcF family protein [Rubrivivax sp.]
MNEIFLTLGVEAWKPLVGALLLPPVPLLLLVLIGARLMYRRRLLAWLLILLGVAGLWLMCTGAIGKLLLNGLLRPPPALNSTEISELRKSPRTAIVILGGGRRELAPEYGVATLTPRSIERLRYGLWLARETGLPAAFSGGIGHGAKAGATEGDIAARIAERDFGRPLRWLETSSRDTRENALRTVALLQPQGIEKIVVVTHANHMTRALRNFERAIASHRMTIVGAPMGVPTPGPLELSDWLPSVRGFDATWIALHEWLGLLAGA